MSEREPDPPRSTTGEDLPGMLRVAASATWHTAEWGLQNYLRTGRRVLSALAPESARMIARDAEKAARELAAASGVDRRVRDAAASSDTLQSAGQAVSRVVGAMPSGGTRSSGPTLQESGEALMQRSRDVWNEEEAHPAYERILSELAPDEGRILMMLLRKGPQPSVDVRTGGPIGILSSRLIAPGLTMIGARAGLRYTDQVPAYLNNLFRLGLVWFSRETLRDALQYQVVEAQPDVLEAMHSVRYPKIVRRSIHLTPFGEDFCRACLVSEDLGTNELPAHALPTEDDEIDPPIAAE
ncbi:MAG: DUF4393 domain-containing protein [Actinomycetota bacterium]|nr:DUF4393 domain-containing protein [Actinomycetota bacterium]